MIGVTEAILRVRDFNHLLLEPAVCFGCFVTNINGICLLSSLVAGEVSEVVGAHIEFFC